jgi:hypothetical protein
LKMAWEFCTQENFGSAPRTDALYGPIAERCRFITSSRVFWRNVAQNALLLWSYSFADRIAALLRRLCGVVCQPADVSHLSFARTTIDDFHGHRPALVIAVSRFLVTYMKKISLSAKKIVICVSARQ